MARDTLSQDLSHSLSTLRDPHDLSNLGQGLFHSSHVLKDRAMHMLDVQNCPVAGALDDNQALCHLSQLFDMSKSAMRTNETTRVGFRVQIAKIFKELHFVLLLRQLKLNFTCALELIWFQHKRAPWALFQDPHNIGSNLDQLLPWIRDLWSQNARSL